MYHPIFMNMITYLRGWNFMRILRLVLGMAILVQGIMDGHWMFIFLGILLSAMPLLNAGCCSSAGCSVPNAGCRTPMNNEPKN